MAAPWEKYAPDASGAPAPESEGPWTKYQPAKAAAPAPASVTAPQRQRDQRLDVLSHTGPLEGVISTGTKMAAASGAGLKGIYDLATGKGADYAAKDVGETAERGSYEPRSKSGQLTSNIVDIPGKLIGGAGHWLGEKTQAGASQIGLPPEAAGVLGAGVDTAFNAIPMYFGARGMRDLPRPKLAEGVKDLTDKGVKLTPPQMLGGEFAAAEEKAQSFPIVGGALKEQRRGSFEGFNKATWNDVLKPLGKDIGDRVGHEAVDHAYDQIHTAYENAKPKMDIGLDKQFITDLGKLNDQQVLQVVRREVNANLKPGGNVIEPDGLKSVESTLNHYASELKRSSVGSERIRGQEFAAAADSFREMIARQDPVYKKAIAPADEAYKLYLRAAGAAGRVGSKEGVFTPSALKSSVRGLDTSKRKGMFARGKAPMQDWAETGEKVMGDKIPNSGTTDRGLAYLVAQHPMQALALGGSRLAVDPIYALLRRYLGKSYGPMTRKDLTRGADAGAYTVGGQLPPPPTAQQQQ